MNKYPVPQGSRGLSKHLTEKQRNFAEHLILYQGRKTATECAVEAGYPIKSARSLASQLQNPKLYPVVANYIEELRDEKMKQFDITYETHLSELGQIRKAALSRGNFSAAVNAEVARGKAAGLYVEQKKILSLTGKIENLTEEQLEKDVTDILKNYSNTLGDVDVKKLKHVISVKKKNS